MDLQARIAQRLAELREARGLSHHQLAKAVGITTQFVVRIEGAERTPSLKVLQALGNALGVDPVELLRTEGPSRDKTATEPVALTQLRGAAQRLSDSDLDIVLALVRRLGRAR